MAGYFYILACESNTTIYKGSTDDIIRRVYEHKYHLVPGSFSDSYNTTKLVYYEYYKDITDARGREAQVGKWSRSKKDNLISKMNPRWEDLYWDLV
ncbi:GIY-YIG nuclease family protein [Anaerococcus sp. NML200537]|uniref:GIY-YIG nuclease family protein n=1 Tax=Anaerococcus sp. NML200537 TaxID=2954485 RepID=UPI002237DC89|nr:GIY-YIG nuclease family protein [Anaerococcus sp. NML200537]MCW6701812.1 GIY-YIG nuclease family protein [Anaerococcus sp. NML200537]